MMLGASEISALLAAAEERALDPQGRVRMGLLRERVLDSLARAPRGMRLMELAQGLDRSKHVIDTALTRLMSRGRVVRLRRGVYALSEAA